MPGLYDYQMPALGGQAPISYPGLGMASLAPMGTPDFTPNPAATAPSGGGFSFGKALGGVAGVGSLFGLVNGIGQLLKSKRMNPIRPEYEIPEETKQMLGLRQNLLNAEMPGEQQARQDIYTNQANTLGGFARGASDQGQYLSLLGAAQAQTNNSLNNLEAERDRNYYQNLNGLERAQQVMSAARDKEWELNKYDPYLMQLQKKYQLQNAGNQNIASGISGLASAALSFL